MHLLRVPDYAYFQIYLDGIDLESLNLKKLRNIIGVVSQEPVLFDGTIESNVRLGSYEVTNEDIVKVCKKVNYLNSAKFSTIIHMKICRQMSGILYRRFRMV